MLYVNYIINTQHFLFVTVLLLSVASNLADVGVTYAEKFTISLNSLNTSVTNSVPFKTLPPVMLSSSLGVQQNSVIKLPLSKDIVSPPISVQRPVSGVGARRPYKIILFPPILFDSHLHIFKTLGKGLTELGHHLTLFVSDRRVIEDNSPYFTVRRYSGIFSSAEGDAFLQSKLNSIFNGKPTFLELLDILHHYAKNCDRIFLTDRDALDELKNDHYDLMIVDPNEMCGFLVAKVLEIPYIVLSTGMWVPYEANVPSPISYVPEFNSQLTDRMTSLDRIYNAVLYSISRIATHGLIFPIYNRLIKKHKIGFKSLESEPEYIAHMITNTKAWLLCTDVALEFARPTMPHVEYIGGILGRPAEPLSKELQEWADHSLQHGGFVVVSFGAGVKRLSKTLEMIFVNVLSKLKERVIWKYSFDTIANFSNIKFVDWLPQNDILAHPNIRAFIGHGGTNGVYESLYHAVPIVGMPLFGDHYDSMARVKAKGIGITLNWKTLTEAQLEYAIYDILNNAAYKNSVSYYSAVHHDQHLKPLERAVNRIDYTLRYNGAQHLRPVALDLSFIKYFLLDIQLLLLGIIIVSFLLISYFTTIVRQSRKHSNQYQLASKCSKHCNRENELLHSHHATDEFSQSLCYPEFVKTIRCCPFHIFLKPTGDYNQLKYLLLFIFRPFFFLISSFCQFIRFIATIMLVRCSWLRLLSDGCLRCTNKILFIVNSKEFPENKSKYEMTESDHHTLTVSNASPLPTKMSPNVVALRRPFDPISPLSQHTDHSDDNTFTIGSSPQIEYPNGMIQCSSQGIVLTHYNEHDDILSPRVLRHDLRNKPTKERLFRVSNSGISSSSTRDGGGSSYTIDSPFFFSKQNTEYLSVLQNGQTISPSVTFNTLQSFNEPDNCQRGRQPAASSRSHSTTSVQSISFSQFPLHLSSDSPPGWLELYSNEDENNVL